MQYQIRSTRYFYGPTKTKTIVKDPWGAPLILPSRRDALTWIRRADKDAYHLTHNESSRPTFVPIPIE